MANRKTARTGSRSVTALPNPPGMISPRKSGRPTRHTAERLHEHILDIATGLFLKHGYGLTSIEAVAQGAHISKRTFYHRFSDKAVLFRAVVNRIIDRLHPPADVPLINAGSLQENLLRLAQLMLQGALSPHGLALSRLIIAESARFPELAVVATEQGGRKEAITLVSGLLVRHARKEKLAEINTEFAAQQFLQMVITIPQRRAMGLGTPMMREEIETWAHDTVDLFLNGCRGNDHQVKQE